VDHHERLVERRTVTDITDLFPRHPRRRGDRHVVLSTLGANIASIVILTALSVGWSVTGLLWLGPRFFTAHWFDRGIADYGQSQGNVATGFILTEMADPAHTTGAAMGYGYKQLFYEPFLGGGILTALSVPLILSIGSLTFGIASAAITTGLIICSVVRNRHASSKPVHDQSSKGPAHLINAPGFRSRSSGDRLIRIRPPTDCASLRTCRAERRHGCLRGVVPAEHELLPRNLTHDSSIG
jgi:hypothetical protein